MRQHVIKAFDEYIPSSAGAVFTRSELNDNLGRFNEIGIQILIDNVSGTTPTFGCWIEHCNDGRNWIIRNGTVTPSAANQADVQFTSTLSTTIVNSGYYSDTCDGTTAGGPLLALVRLRFMFFGTNPAGHVKVWTAHRGGRAH